MESRKSAKKKMFIDRMRFFVEVIFIFIGILLFMLIPRYILPMYIPNSSDLYGPAFYLLRALAIFLAIPLFLFISNIVLESQKKEIIIQEDISPSFSHLNQYRIKKSNFKYQLLYGLIILFVVFIPLDFLTYLIFPQMLEYSAKVISSSPTDSYLTKNYLVFITSVIIIQISVAIYEETLSRGFLTKRGSEYYNKMSATIVASLYFGLMHFMWFTNPVSSNYPIYFPFIWFLQTFFVGILLSILVLKKKWLFPVIFAHALNNIISAHAVWNYLQGNDFILITLYLYLPLLIVGVIMLIWQFSRIKRSVQIGLKEITIYFKERETNSEKATRIGLDMFVAVLIFLLGLITMV